MIPEWLERYEAQRPKGKKLYELARATVAGGVGHDVRHSVPFPLYIDHALGAHKWDVDGNELIDYGMGNGALLLGHAPAAVIAAIQVAIEKGFHFGNDHEAQIEWAAQIQALIPSAERVRFVNSGSEGSMLAARVARAFTKKSKLLRFEGHFSGWSDAVIKGAAYPFQQSASAGILPAVLDSIVVIPADLNVLEETLRKDTDIAALMLEPSGGSWGTVPLSVDFNREVRRLTAQYGVLLIYDEVITGFRYSSGGYQVLAGITPDMSILGKIISGGMPGGALVGRADIMKLFDFTGDPQRDRYERIQHYGTFNANPLSTVAGMVTLREAATGRPQAQADQIATKLREGMNRILDAERIAGYAYGDSSVFHVYLERHPGTGAATREEIMTGDPVKLKGIPGNVVSGFQKNLQIRGADLLSYTGGVTSAAHTDEDVQRTLTIFNETICVLAEAGIVARLA
ncbi:MAG: aminotransferase class III-fold pyridoxal phosphate-dependent enzyme [Anaerolineae bacterium]|nr:aminotransferase class III-fold pyridoxal phosphate-dependent enzyme [Anaerolineae bacterium]